MKILNRGLVATLAVLLAASVAGCTPTPATEPEPTVSPLEARVAAAFTEQADDLGLEGAFLLVRTPDGEFTVPYGTTTRGEAIEPTADTVFRIGSNTKTFTGTVILQLVDQGELRLDDTVSKFRSDVPGGDQITIAMLLSMRSGLFNYTEDASFEPALLGDPERVWEPEELLQMSFRNEPLFAPGTDYAYSNTNTVLLALIAEQITGSSIEDLIADRLTDALGLQHTYLPAIEDAGLEEPFSRGYTFFDQEAAAPGAEPTDVTFLNPSWASSAGAMLSTATELADWAEALTGGALLSPELQAARMGSLQPIPGAPDPQLFGYGLGIAKLEGLFGHNGQLPGYNSYMGADPDRGLTVIVWANVAPGADGQNPADLLSGAVIPLLFEAYPSRESGY